MLAVVVKVLGLLTGFTLIALLMFTYMVEQYHQAMQDYEQLLQVYPKHPNAQSALLELPKISILEGKPEKFNQYLTNYSKAASGAWEKMAVSCRLFAALDGS